MRPFYDNIRPVLRRPSYRTWENVVTVIGAALAAFAFGVSVVLMLGEGMG